MDLFLKKNSNDYYPSKITLKIVLFKIRPNFKKLGNLKNMGFFRKLEKNRNSTFKSGKSKKGI